MGGRFGWRVLVTRYVENHWMLLAALGLVLSPLGCRNNTSQYELLSNEDSDCLTVQVAPTGDDDDSAGDDDDSAADETTSINLTPLAGIFDLDVLGTASLEPASGPAGTEFNISVVLEDTGASQGNPTTAVDRATLVAENGSLALDVLEMDPSPVDERLWTITVVAGGDPATTIREDRLCVGLYTETE